jgi:hypothetical protein
MKYLISLVFFFIICNESFAQRGKLMTNSNISGAIGTATYYGDLSPYRYAFKGLLRSSSFNTSFNYTKEVNERRAHSFGIHFTELRGSDFKYNQNSISVPAHYLRGLHFRNQTLQITFQEKIYLTEKQSNLSSRRNNFLPYVAVGAGLLSNNPSAREPFDGKKGSWRSLRSLNTDGNSKKYSLVVPYLALSVGFNKKLNKHFDFKVQGNLNYSFTDYLDDVSKTPYIKQGDFTNPMSYILHNRMNEPFDALTGKSREAILLNSTINAPTNKSNFRGDNSTIARRFDTFVTTEFGIVYWLN